MKKKNFLLILCLLLILIPVSVWGEEKHGVSYRIDGGEAAACGRVEGNTDKLIIIEPSIIGDEDKKGYDVTMIQGEAFIDDPYLTKLIIRDVIEIGSKAFSGCRNLTTVTIHAVTKIESSVFYNCPNLTSVTLPASVKLIGRKAFKDCEKLKVHYLGTKEQWEKIRGDGKPDISIVDFMEKSSKSANPLKVKGKTVKIKTKKSLPVSKIISFKNKGKRKLSYSISSVNKGGKRFFKINSKTGTLTIKKGLKKGKYKVKIKVTAAGNKKYKAGSKTATVTVRVR